MARVTVEDCIEKIPNRFELVMVSAQRARRIGTGAQLTVARDNDKNPVIALREIAQETVSFEDLREELVKNKQRVIQFNDDQDRAASQEDEKEWEALAEQAAKHGFAEGFDDVDPTEDEDDEGPSLGDLAGYAGDTED